MTSWLEIQDQQQLDRRPFRSFGGNSTAPKGGQGSPVGVPFECLLAVCLLYGSVISVSGNIEGSVELVVLHCPSPKLAEQEQRRHQSSALACCSRGHHHFCEVWILNQAKHLCCRWACTDVRCPAQVVCTEAGWSALARSASASYLNIQTRLVATRLLINHNFQV